MSLRTVPADIIYRRCPTGPVEPVGESDKGYACDKNGEIKRVLEPTSHSEGVGDTRAHSRPAS